MSEIENWWSKAPCEAWHGTAEVGSKEWSNQITKQRYFVQPHITRFAEFHYSNAAGLPWWNHKKILEIGCGIGTDTLEFCRTGADVYACDVSEKSVQIAWNRSLLHKSEYDRLPWIHVVQAEEWLPVDQFELIWSFGVLHHTPHPEKVLLRAHDVLADTGELRIMLYAKYSWKHLFTRQQPEAQAGCPYVKWYSKREARKLLESCGFRVVSIQKTHIFPWRIPEYRNHLYKKAFPWSFISEKYFERFLGHHLLLVATKQ